MTTYNLINPYIGGDMNTSYSGKTPLEVAKKTWVNLSGYLTNNVPRFAFTLERTNDGKLYHFIVNEKVDANKSASFSISNLEVKMSDKQIQSFKNGIKDVQRKLDDEPILDGGKKKHRYHDEDDSSSSESDLENAIRLMKYKQASQPIYYWWYNPLVYNAVDLYIPTFTVPLSPYVHINLNSSFLG